MIEQLQDKISLWGELPDGSGMSKMNFTYHKFNDGSIQVTIPDVSRFDLSKYFKLVCYATSLDDLGVVAQLVDILKRNTRKIGVRYQLSIKSPMYTRYDRVMYESKNDSLGLMVYATLIKSIGVDSVEFLDAHSSATRDAFETIGLTYTEYQQQECVHDFLGSHHYRDFVLVAPDKGAYKKLREASLVLDKVRNIETGEILGVEILGNSKNISFMNRYAREMMIIDDLCEKGGTFLGCIKAIRDGGYEKPVGLYVTHGVFPEGTPFLQLEQNLSKILVHSMTESAYLRCKSNFSESFDFRCLNIYKETV